MKRSALFAAALALVPSVASAQDAAPHRHASSPYAGFQDREIKALSPEQTAALLEGEGMSLALAAELNGFPGPRHVLELADSLGLTPDQRRGVEDALAAMQADARRLGALIVAAERALDSAFATRTVAEPSLRAATLALGRLRGELQGVHLAAHLAVTATLTEHQRHRYEQLRGYRNNHAAH